MSNKIGYSPLNYRYLINSNNSVSVGSLVQNKLSDRIHKYHYSTTGVDGSYFLPIRYLYSNGFTHFTGIKSIESQRAALPRFTIYPNSSMGIVGIKFDYIHSGKILVLITNAQGQRVVKKEFEEVSAYRQIATLQRGIYWLISLRRNEPSVLCQSTFH